MVNSLLELTHYSRRTLLKEPNEILFLLRLLKFFSQETLETLNAFFKKNTYSQFDPHVGETMCQIRAYKIYSLANKLEIYNSEQIISQTKKLIKNLDVFFALLKKNKILYKKNQLIENWLEENGFMLTVPINVLYLVRCYFLTRFKENLKENKTINNIERLCQELNCSKKMAKKIIRKNQLSLAEDSCETILNLYAKNEHYQFLVDFLYPFLKKDDDDRKVIPCFLSTYILTKEFVKNKVNIVLNCNRVLGNNSEKISILFTSEENKNHLSEKTWKTNTPCITINGKASAKDSHLRNKETHIHRLKHYGIAQIINLNMAAHPQYPGEKLAAYNESTYSKLPLFSRELASFTTTYINYKKKAISEGFSKENKNVFFAEHIYCDSILNQIISNNPYVVFYNSTEEKSMSAKKSDTNIVELKDFYENLIAMLPGHIFWKDLECRLLGCNDQQAIDFGYNSRQELIGKSNYELIYSDQPENERIRQAQALDKVDREVMNSEEPYTVEEPLVLPDGSIAIYLSKKVPLRNANDDVVGLLGIGIDITDIRNIENELKEAKEKVEAANKAKSELLAIVSQKIKEPLNAIMGAISLAENKNTNANIAEYIESAKLAAEKIHPMLQSVDDFLQLENEPLKLSADECNITDIINHVIQSQNSQCEKNNNKIFFENKLQKNFPKTIFLDSYWLMRAIETLLSNAIRFTYSGNITLSITEKQTNIVLSIVDTGRGFSQEKLKSVFNLYPKNSKEINLKTFGVKLSITKHLIERMGGDLSIESTPGKGTIATITVPYSVSKKTFVEEHKERNRALLIEDDLLSQKIEKGILEFIGFDVTVASSGKEAFLYQEGQYDVIFIDINLPDTSGTDLCKQFKKNPAFKNTTFIAITSFLEDTDLEKYFKAGFSEVIGKPITIDSVRKKLHLLFADDNNFS